MIKLNIKKNKLCWTWGTSPVPCWYRGVWSESWVNYSPLRPLEIIWEACKNGHVFVWMIACVLFHMT